MDSERFVLIDDYDGGCAIRDSSKPQGYDILASLPVHAWAMAPLVDELNKLQTVVEAARGIDKRGVDPERYYVSIPGTAYIKLQDALEVYEKGKQ